MENVSPIEIFVTLLIGMGPLKVLLAYMALTQEMPADVRRQVALRTVLVAGAVGLVLLVFGALFQALLHFSIGALTITGGLILIILGLNMVLGSHQAEKGEAPRDPMRIAVSPLAIPLMLNPVGVVALVTLSAKAQAVIAFAVVVGMIAAIMAINLAALSFSARLQKLLSPPIVELMERVMGILLGALAVQLILDGLVDVGVIARAATPH